MRDKVEKSLDRIRPALQADGGNVELVDVDEEKGIVKVKLTGAFLACRAVVPVMKNQGRGKIVNMASLAGRTGRPGVGV